MQVRAQLAQEPHLEKCQKAGAHATGRLFAIVSGISIFLESPPLKNEVGRKGWDVAGSRRGTWREQWRKSSSRNAKPNIPPPNQIFLFFFQEGKLYFPASSIHKRLCRALLMGYAKLRSPYRAIGRRGGRLERTTRELCMIFFDELIIQKFHRS